MHITAIIYQLYQAQQKGAMYSVYCFILYGWLCPTTLLTSFNLQLSFDLLKSWLRRNSDIVGMKKDGISVFRELALFQDYHGLPALKNVRQKENGVIKFSFL